MEFGSIQVTGPDWDGEIKVEICDCDSNLSTEWITKEQAKALGEYLIELSKEAK